MEEQKKQTGMVPAPKPADLPLVKPEDLSLVPDNFLNPEQLSRILKRTPAQYVRKRPAKGGGQWDYVSGGYVKKTLNLIFGFDWDFEILHQEIISGEAIVKGRLTCRCGGRAIVKTQFGNKEIKYKRDTQDPLSIGNDLKAAATDALKKCAAELGIAADIYNKEEFREIFVDLGEAQQEQDQTDQNMRTIEELLKDPHLEEKLRTAVSNNLEKINADSSLQERAINSMRDNISKNTAK